MNAQFKKGVLELVVLESVRKKDMYGYELVEEVSKVIDVNEGTIYPLLKRLTNEHYFETYLHGRAAAEILPFNCCRSPLPGEAGAGVERISAAGMYIFKGAEG